MSSLPKQILDEPISPELALVSPELAAIARAGLPDRPWEAFLPRREPAGDSAADPAVDEASRLRPPATAQPPIPPAEAEAAAVVVASRGSSRGRPRVPVGLVLLAAFAGLVIAGSVLPVRDAPTLGPPSAQANGLSVPQDPPATTPGVQAPTTPEQPTTVPASPGPPSTTTTSRHEQPAPRNASRVQVRPRSGYVFARGSGLLRVDDRGRKIAELQSTVGCGRQLVVRGIRIAPDGRFKTHRIMRGRGHPTVTITGVFVGATNVRGTIRVKTGHCDSGPVRFVGRLS